MASPVGAQPRFTVQVIPRWLRVDDNATATLIVTGYLAQVGPGRLEPLLSWPGRLA